MKVFQWPWWIVLEVVWWLMVVYLICHLGLLVLVLTMLPFGRSGRW